MLSFWYIQATADGPAAGSPPACSRTYPRRLPLQKLRSGVAKFRSEILSQKAAKFSELAEGQHPRVVLITCSDSRIDPSLLCQTDPGDLFVIRNAGNIVPPEGSGSGGEIATLEYAIKALQVPQILVCGHSKCGAMGAVMDPESAASLGHVCNWIEHAKPAHRDGSDLATLLQDNVRHQIANLRTYDFIREAEADGRLTLHGWVYRFETGDVEQLDPETGTFERLGTET